ncbi:TetR family transcriptional regulator [Ferroplasma acidiphilum]|jgi:AcrR family transcriptional regulator|uniref:TetR family transcriptional regulator n=2 Tax=Ferroplasma TaxID=74968 RepID=S0AQU7_FERAC|nr:MULTISPECIES: TetR/AcrR family transcriptional regulator [Ferroplasma]AGO60455.1 TetR family transcriptional regulator [Ferroplasma acidarmanus Fer1]ARD85249.1 TetR family transcriptional regulator [Ferroplasma acidiphilum]MCL4349441.1 TetR/AcrR family transcriptional regulator [Candidatus Thermoplasmatota archaeon]
MPKVIQDYREMAKEKIIESASKLFFQMGYNNAGMENIARDMGITKGTLYLYFKNKEELLNKTCKVNMDLLETNLKKSVSGNMITGIEKFFADEMKLPDYKKFYWIFALNEINVNNNIKEIIENSYKRYVKYISDLIENLKQDGTISESINSTDLARILIAFHNGVLISIMQGLDNPTATSIFNSGIRSLFGNRS